MAFAFESQMIPVLKSNVLKLFNNDDKDSVAIAEELPVNHRIVDLVIAAMENNVIIDNIDLKKRFQKLSMAELDMLSIFYQNNVVSIQKLTKHLRMKPERIKKLYLDKFIDLNFLIKLTRYSYQTTEWAKFNPSYLIAIEAKLSKWNNVLNQAVDNLNFADFSYAALSANRDFKKEVIEKFKNHNIGVIMVDETGEFEIIFQPEKNIRYNEPDFRLQRLRLYRDLICKNSKWYIPDNLSSSEVMEDAETIYP